MSDLPHDENPTRPRVVGFDLDLTLVDTRARILHSTMAAFADLEVPMQESRIVPHLGGPVTTPRTDVQYIATEYGVVNMRGKTLKEREPEDKKASDKTSEAKPNRNRVAPCERG